MDKNKVTIARGALTFVALICAICFLPFNKKQDVNLQLLEIAKCDCKIVTDTHQLSQLGTEP